MKLTLEVLEGPHAGEAFSFERHSTFLVGRDESAHLPLTEDRHFSRHHFLLELNPPHCCLRDLGSRNGTLVNGERVSEASLKHGDVISGGRTRIQLSVEGKPPPPIVCLSCGQQPEMATVAFEGSADATASYVCPPCRTRIEEQPQPVPGFEVVRLLGRGGMGVVHLARRLSDGEVVAVKTILPEAVAGEKAVQLFLREASVLSQLVHPRIVKFFEVGMAHGQFYFVMEYVPAVDLASLLAALPIRSRVRTAAAVICQMLESLAFAHGQGFVHRDIKPSNILVTRDGKRLRTKLSDFGLAKNFENGGFSGMTRSGEIRGSVPYMAPEQIIDCRLAQPSVDIYSTGATLYHLISGRYPHEFSSNKDPYGLILDAPILPLSSRVAEVPDVLSDVVSRSLARRAADRFATADEFRRALLPFARDAKAT